MKQKIFTLILCLALVFTITACNSKEKQKEEEAKAKAEAQLKENEEKANAVVSSIESLPEDIKLKDESAVTGARAAYDALTDEQKELVSEDLLTRLEDAEKRIEELKEKKAKKKANKQAAAKVEEKINALPQTITLDSEGAVTEARNAYNGLTDAQKKFVSNDAINKLTSAEASIISLKAAEEKKKQEEEEAAKKKKEEKKSEKKNEKKEEKKEEPKQDKYSIAKKYVGKKASALVGAIGAPKSKKKNPNCATDGEEYIYYYDGFYVGVLSQTMQSPLIVQNVTKN